MCTGACRTNLESRSRYTDDHAPCYYLPKPMPILISVNHWRHYLFTAHYVRMVARQSSDVKDIHRGESLRLSLDIPYERYTCVYRLVQECWEARPLNIKEQSRQTIELTAIVSILILDQCYSGAEKHCEHVGCGWRRWLWRSCSRWVHDPYRLLLVRTGQSC